MDIWSKEKRSEVMSRIGGKNTRGELLLRSALFSLGLRFRIHVKGLPGKPDIVLPKYKTIIFVHGCFWHFHKGCKEGRIPSSDTEYWRLKLEKNVKRDSEHIHRLKKNNWTVLVVWECEVEKNIDKVIERVTKHLKKQEFRLSYE